MTTSPESSGLRADPRRRRLGDVLVESGVLTPPQLTAGLEA